MGGVSASLGELHCAVAAGPSNLGAPSLPSLQLSSNNKTPWRIVETFGMSEFPFFNFRERSEISLVPTDLRAYVPTATSGVMGTLQVRTHWFSLAFPPP